MSMYLTRGLEYVGNRERYWKRKWARGISGQEMDPDVVMSVNKNE